MNVSAFASRIITRHSLSAAKRSPLGNVRALSSVQPTDYVPIYYKRSTVSSNEATFDTDKCFMGGSALINCATEGGHVFAGIEDGGFGDYLKVEGASYELLDDPEMEYGGWSGDTGMGQFKVKHDGVSGAIVVTYGTRAD